MHLAEGIAIIKQNAELGVRPAGGFGETVAPPTPDARLLVNLVAQARRPPTELRVLAWPVPVHHLTQLGVVTDDWRATPPVDQTQALDLLHCTEMQSLSGTSPVLCAV